MRISVVAICKNEEVIMPFLLRHYSYADEIIICDNHSTDRTLEIVKTDPRCQIIPYNTKVGLRDDVNLSLKNTIYKGLNTDWVIVIDCDEFIYHPNIRELLTRYLQEGITLPKVEGWNMVGKALPVDDGKTLLTDLIQYGTRGGVYHPQSDQLYWYNAYDKRAIFHKSIDINFSIGCHDCQPVGPIKESQTVEIKLLHYKFLSRDWAIYRSKNIGLSPQNIANNWAIYQANPDWAARWYDLSDIAKVKVI